MSWETPKVLSDFHPDAVTARTISRLSQGVARLTSDDFKSRDSRSSYRKSLNLQDNISTNLKHPSRSNKRLTEYNSHLQSLKSLNEQTNLKLKIQLNVMEYKPWSINVRSCQALVPQSMTISDSLCGISDDNSHIHSYSEPTYLPCVNPFSKRPSFLTKLPAHRITPGSKRNFSHVIASLTKKNSSSHSPSYNPTVSPEKGDFAKTVKQPALSGNRNKKQSRHKNKLISLSDNCCNEKIEVSSVKLTNLSASSKDPSCLSDSSMHSLKSRSCSSTSLSPVETSESDSEHQRLVSKSNTLSTDYVDKRKGKSKDANLHMSDCWKWRSPKSFASSYSTHTRSHRVPIVSSNGDDSSDGPLCKQKKPRVSFPGPFWIESFDFIDKYSDDKTTGALSSAFKSQNIQQSLRCICLSPIALRRASSLSPGKTHNNRKQKPMKFRSSQLESAASIDTDRTLLKKGLSPLNFRNPVCRDFSQLSYSQDGVDGDDECSDVPAGEI